MRRFLILLLALLLMGCSEKPDESAPAAAPAGEAQTSEQTLEGPSKQTDEVREPAEELPPQEIAAAQDGRAVVFSVEKLRSDPVPVLSVPYTVEETISCGEYVFTRCRTGDDSKLSLFITVDGIPYDLGSVYRRIIPGEDGVESYKIELTQIAAPEPVYMLHTFEYMMVTTTYFAVRNGVPVVLYEMEHLRAGAIQFDIDMDGEEETVCNHDGSTSVNQWLYEWDVAAGEVRVADLREQLGCDFIVYQEETGRISADTRLENGWNCTEYLYRDGYLTEVETSVSYSLG